MVLEEKLRRAAGTAGIASVLLAAFVVAGWTGLRKFSAESGSGNLPMSPACAACVGLLGLALWLQGRKRNGLGWVAAALAALALAVGIILERLLHFPFHTHGWFPRELDFGLHQPPSLHAGALLVIAATAILSLRQERSRERWPISAWLANVVVAIGAAALLAASSRAGDADRPIQITTQLAASLLIIGFGTLLSRPDDKHVRTLFARNAAGVLARRLFLAVAVMPVVFGFVFIQLMAADRVDAMPGVMLFVAATIITGFLVALFSVETATGMSEEREEAENARLLLTARLQEQAAQLQETVSQRTQELREANASLRATAESNALLAMVAQNTTNGVVIANAEGRIEWVNAAFSRITGYELSEVKGRKPGEFLQGPGSDHGAVERLRSAVRHGQACHLDILNYTKQGRPFWHTVDLQPVRERSGRLVNFVANLTDITTEREDKIRLEQLSERLKLATRTAELGVWEWDAQQRQSVWDARALEIYGLTADQFHGTAEDWLARVHRDDRARADAQIQQILQGANGYQHEFRIYRANDGQMRYLSSRAIAERDNEGRLLRIIGTDRDITAARESTQQLHQLNERLQLALRSSKYGVWEYDIGKGRHFWDDRLLQICGLQREMFDGSGAAWQRTFHPEDVAAIQTELEQILTTKVSDYEMQYRIVQPNSTVRHVESHGHVQRDANGRAVRIVGLSRDITESKQLEQALALAEQRW